MHNNVGVRGVLFPPNAQVLESPGSARARVHHSRALVMASSSAKPEPDPALKAKLASLVSRLTAELGVGGGRSAEGLATASVAMLSKMISPYDVTQGVRAAVAKGAGRLGARPRGVRRALREAQGDAGREVDKYLAVVAKIAGLHPRPARGGHRTARLRVGCRRGGVLRTKNAF